MAKHAKEVTNTLYYESPEKGWSLKMRSTEAGIHLDLHYGDKVVPTHELTLTRLEFKELVKDLGFSVEDLHG